MAKKRGRGGHYDEWPTAAFAHADCRLGYRETKQHPGHQRHRTAKLVLPHDQAAGQADERSDQGSENDAHRGRVASPAMTTGPGVRQEDWITQLLDKLDEIIEFVRGKTTEPLAKLARYLVYLSLFAVVGMTLAALLLIMLVRLLAIIPGPMWTGYAGLAALFTISGTWCWRKAIKATR